MPQNEQTKEKNFYGMVKQVPWREEEQQLRNLKKKKTKVKNQQRNYY